MLSLQLEQEMDLILKSSNGYYQFQSEWREKWSPAIIKYLRKCRKKELKTAASQLDHISDSGKPYLLGEFRLL